jgi:hypothetical protein
MDKKFKKHGGGILTRVLAQRVEVKALSQGRTGNGSEGWFLTVKMTSSPH